jgi:hypothetical protein
MNKGWIKLYRQIEEDDFWLSEPFSRGQAWVDLLLLANHQKSTFFIRGNEITAEVGQVAWSERRLAMRWHWSRNKLRNFLKLLQKRQQIEPQKTAANTLITIVNYKKFQEKDHRLNHRKTTEGTTEGTHNKNDKNEENEKKIISKDIEETSKSFGNEEINLVLDFLKKTFGLEDFKESKQWQRNFGKNLVSLLEKIGREEFRRRLEVLAKDSFKRKNCNSLTFIYGELKSTPTNSGLVKKKGGILTV